ncbi:MAG: flagellar protein FliS [Planctomycetes bacterium]|nr:flagellar protein FliS [Planctomycetota bacterium]MCC7169601.1 flagellar protein FliS [Planctomycetota bacterium]
MANPNSSPAAAYQRDEILTSSPVRLVCRVYAGAITALERARKSHESGDDTAHRKELWRARALIGELMGAVDHDDGGDIANRLTGLYEFLLTELLRPRAQPDLKSISAAETVLRKLKEGFDGVLASGAEARTLA